jgi:hypothetical protein
LNGVPWSEEARRWPRHKPFIGVGAVTLHNACFEGLVRLTIASMIQRHSI